MADIKEMRIKKLRKALKKNKMDSILITDLKNVFYYSGYTGTSAYLIISLEDLYLITDFRYTTQCKEQCPLFKIIDFKETDVKSICSKFFATGFENLSIGYNQYINYCKMFKNLLPVNDMILRFRAKKSIDEVKSIKKAVKIADDAFLHILKFAKCGVTEIEIANEIDFFMKRKGASSNSFDTICASGARGALPHAFPTSKKLEYGDLVVLDFGCVYRGYCSDITRTFAVGDIDKDKKKVYDTVLYAQKTALEAVKKGNKCSDIHNIAQNIIEKDYKGMFGHSLGHSVGLDIHENPNLSPKNDKVLETGNVVTVEPGIYIPDFCGVRIEDLVYVSKNETHILTNSPKELLYVE
ncbi:MAG: aminopeptidase P family protein [Ruminococcaceae bacterium]|nr:aminopeptidase P family protein [Oscillospiraceae bacterium]